tara:strand:- start:2907 stop:3086 length:180 start_codon:yes stop_codon:yes gene_type:complete
MWGAIFSEFPQVPQEGVRKEIYFALVVHVVQNFTIVRLHLILLKQTKKSEKSQKKSSKV